MAKTKGEVVKTALTLIGIADYEFDIIPEELATGVDFLNLMMSLWSNKSLKVPYNFDGDAEDSSGLPDIAIEAVAANLAIRLAPSYGKQVPMEVRTLAKQGLNALFSESAKPLEMQLDTIPSGAGHKFLETSRFFTPTNKYPWELETLDDFSGGEPDFFLDDVGKILSFDFFGEVDLSTAATTIVRYRAPDGTEDEWTGVVSGDYVTYTTVSGDIDQTGVWYAQAFATFASGAVVSSKIQSYWVAETVGDA